MRMRMEMQMGRRQIYPYDPFEGVKGVRRLFMMVANSNYFQNVVLLAILVNCWWMGYTACIEGEECVEESLSEVVEFTFIVIYTVEFVVMVCAYPPTVPGVCRRVNAMEMVPEIARAISAASIEPRYGILKKYSFDQEVQHDLVVGVRKYAPRMVLFVRVDPTVDLADREKLQRKIADVCQSSCDNIPECDRPKEVVCLSKFPKGGPTVRDRALRRVQVGGYDLQDDTKRTREYNYFKDSWNSVDIVCLVTAYMQLFEVGENMTMLRSFRVLRVLRTVNKIPTLKAIVQAIFASAPMLASSAALLCMMVVLWGIAGVQFFGGELSKRCYDPWVDSAPTMEGQSCGSRGCPAGFVCGLAPKTKQDELDGFDSIGVAMLTIVQC
eukprot:67403_6